MNRLQSLFGVFEARALQSAEIGFHFGGANFGAAFAAAKFKGCASEGSRGLRDQTPKTLESCTDNRPHQIYNHAGKMAREQLHVLL